MSTAVPPVSTMTQGVGRAKRRRPPILALGIALVLLVILAIAVVIADNAVRTYAEDRVREEVASALGLPDGAPLDVRISGFSMLLQLASGSIDRVDVHSDSVAFGELTGPLQLVARGVPTDRGAPVDLLSVRFAADESQLTRISANLSAVPITSVAIEGDEIDVAAEVKALFIALPLTVALEPSAVDGQIAFSPTRISVAGAEFSADDLRDRFGSVAADALRTQNLCIAEFLPAPLVLQDVQLDDPRMVLTFGAEDVVLGDASFEATGSC